MRIFSLWMPSVTHISDLPLKNSLFVLESSTTYDCGTFVDRKLYKLSIPLLNITTQMACLMIFCFVLTGCQYILLLLYSMKLKLESQSCLPQHQLPKMLFRSDAWHCNDDVHIIQELIFMVSGQIWKLQNFTSCYSICTYLTNFISYSVNMTADLCTHP